MNERSNSKTDITFELKTVENLRRSIKGKWHCSYVCYYSHIRYCPCYCSHTVHTYGMMTWHWPITWHWPMRCYDPIELKFLCTVDRWRSSMLVDQKSCVRYMHIHMINYNQSASLFKPRGQTTYCWPMTWRNPERPKYF